MGTTTCTRKGDDMGSGETKIETMNCQIVLDLKGVHLIGFVELGKMNV